jgi:hypothetical protein
LSRFCLHTTTVVVLVTLGCGVRSGFTPIYVEPTTQLRPLSHAFVNPVHWPFQNLTNHTASVFWQRGTPSSRLTTPSAAEIGTATGVSATPEQQVVATGSGPTGTPPNVPFSAVQLTSTGVWGAWLNTTSADPTAEHLTTTTIESSFGTCYDVWQPDHSGEFRVEFQLAVPTAFKLSPANGCAVYVSLSVYVRTKPGLPSHFIWYSVNLFDFERDVRSDHVFIDTVSKKLIVSSGVTGGSKYNVPLPGSASSSNTTWPTPKSFGYRVTATNLEQGIRDGLATYPTLKGLPEKASDYCISGYNMELEATPDAAAGMSLSGTTISVGSVSSVIH